MATQAQIWHINHHFDAFHHHTGYDSVEEYFSDFEDDRPNLYEGLCADLGLEGEVDHFNELMGDGRTGTHHVDGTQCDGLYCEDNTWHDVAPLPVKVPETEHSTGTSPPPAEDVAFWEQLLAEGMAETGQASEVEQYEQGVAEAIAASAQVNQPQQGLTMREVLGQIDPRDSDSALLMLDYLIQTGRLNRVGVLDGGQGYMFIYKEPKGTTKPGYRPGGTQGDRIVDAAVEQARANSTVVKRGMCPHCFSAVQDQDGRILLDDETLSETCENSPNGKHGMAS